jgi:hypothetical protein
MLESHFFKPICKFFGIYKTCSKDVPVRIQGIDFERRTSKGE